VSLDKPLDQIQEADLQGLIENQVSELRTLEYKEALPGNSDSDRKEFLADASSFANAAGGHLIFGMKAQSGVASELCGLDLDGDAAISSLESRIRDGISPRIPGVHSTSLKLANSRIAIVIRIPRSFAAPHMVSYKGTSRFYSRTSNGKFQLDVAQIRVGFLNSEATAERIRDFRAQRIGTILAGETPWPIREGPKVVLHLIPLSAFDRDTQIDLRSTSDVSNLQSLAPLFHKTAYIARINIDGYLVYLQISGETKAVAYTQLFRNGVIETVDCLFLIDPDGKKRIASLAFEQDLIRDIHRFLMRLKALGVEPPILIMLSLLNVKEFYMSMEGMLGLGLAQEQRLIDRNVLLPSEIVVESYSPDLKKTLKPLFDAIWNASGHYGSPYYKNGEWIGDKLS
jgi:hypothetical protein